jgi:Bacterial protein of unknown function (DUF937)/OmpA family
MATNLLEMVKQALPPDFADKAGGLIGESGGTTASALGAALPALLAGIAQKGASPGGAQAVSAMLDNPVVDTSMLSNLSGLFGGAGTPASATMASGTSLLTSLFGDKASALAGALSSVSGMRGPQSATNLLALLAPIVLAVIKRVVGGMGGGTSALASLLGQQGQFLQGALDSRLTGALGFASPSAMLAGVSGKVAGAADTASQATMRAGAATGAVAQDAGSWIGRWWPWIVAAIIILFLLSRCMNREQPAAPAPAPAAPPPAAIAPAPAPAAAMPTALPAKVYFDVGQTTLSDAGKATVAAIADLVKKDGGKVDVTGYADSTGDPAQNAEIAKNRAMAVRDALQAGGVDPAMINLAPPANFTGTGGDAEARRVEVSKAQ